MIDRKRLVQTLVGVHAFYKIELSEYAIRIWATALDGFDAATLDAAFDRHVIDPDAGRFCPKPADILRQIRGDANDAALVAWGQVLEAARGGAAAARFDGAARKALDSLGGLSVIGRADESQNGHLQRRFCDAFKAYRRYEEHDLALLGGVAVPQLADDN